MIDPFIHVWRYFARLFVGAIFVVFRAVTDIRLYRLASLLPPPHTYSRVLTISVKSAHSNHQCDMQAREKNKSKPNTLVSLLDAILFSIAS